MSLKRRSFYEPARIVDQVEKRIAGLKRKTDPVDYLTFVPDGEPTLDANLGQTLDLLKPLGIRVAVITNSSLVQDAGVRSDLAKAAWVSVKVDAAGEET